MSAFEDFWPGLQPMVGAIAWEYGGKARQYGADSEDFTQEFIAWLLEHEDKVADWLADTERIAEADHYIAKCLRNVAKDHLREIKAQSLGYSPSDEFFYTRNELRNLLGEMFNPESWLNAPRSEGRTAKTPAEGGNWIATLSDVARAYGQLPPDHRDLLAGFHRDGWTNKMMASAYQVSEPTMSRWHDKAVRALHEKLGGERPGSRVPGDPWKGRRATSNEAARSYQSKAYEDGVA